MKKTKIKQETKAVEDTPNNENTKNNNDSKQKKGEEYKEENEKKNPKDKPKLTKQNSKEPKPGNTKRRMSKKWIKSFFLKEEISFNLYFVKIWFYHIWLSDTPSWHVSGATKNCV